MLIISRVLLALFVAIVLCGCPPSMPANYAAYPRIVASAVAS